MRAAVVTEQGVRVQDAPRPDPGPDQVLVRVRACGLNRADLTVAAGAAHGSVGGPGTIVGMEFAGDVAALGPGVQDFREGDRVMCSGAAGWAEYALADRGRTALIPGETVSYAQAATLPVATQTMHNAIVTNGRLAAGETVLIQGASSGVGLMGLQIARLKGASLVIGTSTNQERRDALARFGADLALDPRDPDWVARVLEATDGAGVNLIVDQVSGFVANDNMRAAAILGRIVNVGRLGGATCTFDCDLHALRRIHYIGVTFRTRSIEEIRAITRAVHEDLGDAIAAGTLALPIDSSYPLEAVTDALDHMRGNRHLGKIVLTLD